MNKKNANIQPLLSRFNSNHTQLLSTAALYAGSLSVSLSASGLSISFFILLLISLIEFPKILETLKKEPILWLLFGLISYTLISQLIDRGAFPGPWRDTTTHILKASFIFLTGYWFYENRLRIGNFLTVYAIGFLARSLIEFPWDHFHRALSGQQLVNLGFDHIECGELAGLAALIFIFFSDRQSNRWNKQLSVAWTGVSWLAGLWSFLILILSRSRSAWVAAFITLFFIATIYTIHAIQKNTISKRTIAFSLVVGLFCFSIALVYSPNIQHRITPVVRSLHHFQHKGLSGVNKNSSSGMRINLFVYGVKKWAEKPFFGWGNSTSKTLIQRGGINHNVSPGNQSYSFLNTPIQLLVELGMVGVGLITVIIILIVRGLIRAASRGTIDRRVAYMLLAILLYKLVFNLFDVTYVYMLDTALILVFGGMAFGICLGNRDIPESTKS